MTGGAEKNFNLTVGLNVSLTHSRTHNMRKMAVLEGM